MNDYAICFRNHPTDYEIPPMKLHEYVNSKQHISEVSKQNVAFL